jgi:cysteine desulfurase
VLAAMGVRPELGKGAVRLSVGRYTTEGEVDEAARLLAAAAQ